MSEVQRDSWPAFLPGIENAINAALESLAKQDAGVEAIPEVDPTPARQQLQRLADRICGLPACASCSADAVAELDAVLQTSEQETRDYLQLIEDLRRKLVRWCDAPS